MRLDVNTDAVIKYSNKLEKLSRSGFPVAVRQSLNKTALDLKKRSLIAVTNEKFTVRQKNFFRAFTKIIFAKGFKIKSMSSAVGVFPAGNDAAENLETQERGGKIGGRTFIPTRKARVSRKVNKPLARRRTLKNFRNVPRVPWGNKKKFMMEVSKAERGDAIIYGSSMLLITGKTKRGGGRPRVKAEVIYSFKKNRSVRVKPVRFMQIAGMISANRLEIFYKLEAKKQINRILKI